MIDCSQLFCTQTDRCLEDLKHQDIERLQFSVFCAVGEDLDYDLINLTKAQSDKIESICLGDAWLHHAVTHNILYSQEDEVELTIEFNSEVDHFDLDGNFVKGKPND